MPSARATPAAAVLAPQSSIARNASTSRDTRNVARTAVPAVSAFAKTVGYSRAVRDGRHVYMSGTAPVGLESEDPYEQAKRCLEIILEALHELGAGPEHVV